MVVTADPDVIEYARSRTEFQTTPLPFDRVYVILSTTRYIEPESIRMDSLDTATLSDAFSRGAVRADVRSASSSYWWDEAAACDLSYPPKPEYPGRPPASFYSTGNYRLLYDRGDPVARDIAERIVALSLENRETSPALRYLEDRIPRLGSMRSSLTSRGVEAEELRRESLGGNEFAYLLSFDIRPDSPCAEFAFQAYRANWLAGNGPDGFSRKLVPVVETRPYLITRDNHPALYVDWFGNIVFGPPPSDRRP
jgi:hypothetical protein